ncbi:hypothetical protein LLH00_11370 [bacterium]|nr:hypothetical protein [bacterium]
MRNKPGFPLVFGYTVAVVTVAGGVVLLFNLLDLQTIPLVRLTFGSLLVLVGVYRVLITRLRYHTSPLDAGEETEEERDV